MAIVTVELQQLQCEENWKYIWDIKVFEKARFDTSVYQGR